MTYIATKTAVININNAYRTYTFRPIRGRPMDDGLTAAVILTNNIDIPIMNHTKNDRGFNAQMQMCA
jgi:hypothetical protein